MNIAQQAVSAFARDLLGTERCASAVTSWRSREHAMELAVQWLVGSNLEKIAAGYADHRGNLVGAFGTRAHALPRALTLRAPVRGVMNSRFRGARPSRSNPSGRHSIDHGVGAFGVQPGYVLRCIEPAKSRWGSREKPKILASGGSGVTNTR